MNPIIELYATLWTHSKKKWKIIVFTLCFLVSQVFSFLEPLVIGWLISTIETEGLVLEKIVWILLSMVGLRFGFWLFHGPGRILELAHAFDVRADFKKHYLHNIFAQNYAWHTQHQSGDTFDKVEKGSLAIYEFSRSTFEIIDTLIRFVSSFFALIYFNIHSSYIVVLLFIITIWIIRHYDKKIIPMQKDINRSENTLSAYIFDLLANVQTLVILRAVKTVESAIQAKLYLPFETLKKQVVQNETKWFLVSIMTALMMFFVIGSYIFFISTTTILISNLYILYSYIERINNLFYRFAYRYADMIRYQTALQNTQELELQEQKRQESHIVKGWKKLEYKNVEFSYGKNKHNLHVSLSIRNGEKIAFIGESGSGKTTTAKLLRGMYTPEKGKLLIDQKEMTIEQISASIVLIPQDAELYKATIKENISFDARTPEKDLIPFTNLAQVTKVIQQLPKGFESIVKEKGVNLSGGEKQRIALARGLYAARISPIILLDEPTSSLDPKNEFEVFTHIFHYFENRTIVCVVHRMHLLALFDKIYVFDEGKIVANGTFKEIQHLPSVQKLIRKKFVQ